MKTIYEAKRFIKSNIGKKVTVKILGIRNKNELIEGIISECYPNVFLVTTKNSKRSFTYTDVLIGNIIIKIK